jgi:hypothetical protein
VKAKRRVKEAGAKRDAIRATIEASLGKGTPEQTGA